MKIAFVVHDYNKIFGHARYVAELAERFSRDHEVHVFANTIDAGGETHVAFHRVPAWRLNAMTTILSFFGTCSIALPRGFDIVHGQGMCAWPNDVVTVHQVNREWQVARCQSGAVRAWRERVFGVVVSGLERRFFRALRHSSVIAVSDRVRQDLGRHYVTPERTSTIHHGVDVGRFSLARRLAQRPVSRAKLGVAEDEVLFLFVGDLRKGFHECMRALAELPGGRLICVSFSKPAEWQTAAAALGLEGRVIFAGPSPDVDWYHAAADVLVFPTPYDPFGLVATEAMASGLPVVVSRRAGAAELIQDGVNGVLLDDPADVDELRRRMAALSADPPARMALGAAAAATMQEHTWDRVASETMGVYRSHLEARASGAL